VIAQHLNSPLPELRVERPDVPAGLIRLVQEMTEKDSGKRPQSYAALRTALAEAAEPIAIWKQGSPYRGLATFEFEHAPIFFGRRRAIEDVIAALRAQAANGRALVLVLGMSGSGKSSLVRAGVLPQMTQTGVIEGVREWRRAVLRPGETAGDLFNALAAALMQPDALPQLATDGTTVREL